MNKRKKLSVLLAAALAWVLACTFFYAGNPAFAGGGRGLPVITASPGHLQIDEGQEVEFTVEASGEGLSYQWQVTVPEYGWVSNPWMDLPEGVDDIIGTETATITLPASTAETYSTAGFRCVVKNDSGSVISETAVLTVIGKYPPTLETVLEIPIINQSPGSGLNIAYPLTTQVTVPNTAPAFITAVDLGMNYGESEWSLILCSDAEYTTEIFSQELVPGLNDVYFKIDFVEAAAYYHVTVIREGIPTPAPTVTPVPTVAPTATRVAAEIPEMGDAFPFGAYTALLFIVLIGFGAFFAASYRKGKNSRN